MPKTCIDCGKSLPLRRRLLGRARCEVCEARFNKEEAARIAREHAEHQRAVEEYREAVDQLQPGVDVDVVAARIQEAMKQTPLGKTEIDQLNSEAISHFIEQAASDGVLTPGEDQFLDLATRLPGVEINWDQFRDWVMASLESGIVLRSPGPAKLILRADEILHLQANVELLERQVNQEMRWVSQGLSIPVGHSGVRYRINQGRGHLVTTGTTIQVADRGALVVTSERVAFAGANGAMEFPYRRVLGVRLLADAVGLQIANRQSVPMFRTGSGWNEVTAMAIVVSAQRAMGSFTHPPWREAPPSPTPPLPRMLVSSGYRDPGGSQATSGPTEADTGGGVGAPVSPPGHQQHIEEPDHETERSLSEEAEFARRLRQLDKAAVGSAEAYVLRMLIEALPPSDDMRGQLRPKLDDGIRRLEKQAQEVGLPPSLTPSLDAMDDQAADEEMSQGGADDLPDELTTRLADLVGCLWSHAVPACRP